MNWLFTFSLLTSMLALVSVFVEIPFTSNYAFWVLLVAYVMLAGSTTNGKKG